MVRLFDRGSDGIRDSRPVLAAVVGVAKFSELVLADDIPEWFLFCSIFVCHIKCDFFVFHLFDINTICKQ